jgi:hypothetical protein
VVDGIGYVVPCEIVHTVMLSDYKIGANILR